MAFRILGSHAEADDAVQETWLRLSRSDVSDVAILGGWLTTVVARICLDVLRARTARREESGSDVLAGTATLSDPEYEALLSDSVGTALAVVLDTLNPARTSRIRPARRLRRPVRRDRRDPRPVAARSEAAREPRACVDCAGSAPVAENDLTAQREVVDAFLAASRAGDLAALVAVLDPDIVLRADLAAVRMGAPEEVRGDEAVASIFSGRALEAQPAVIDGAAGIAWAPGGRPRVVWELEIENGTVARIDMLAAPETLAELDLVAGELGLKGGLGPMLGMNAYPREYVAACRSRVESHVADMPRPRGVRATQPISSPSSSDNMLLALDRYFVHRCRTLERKDGNPLNEVRVMCNSMMLHDDVLTREKGIKLDPATSVLGIAYGETIALCEADFTKLAEAFFTEIARTFAAQPA